VVYPHKIHPREEENPDTLSGRITAKKLKSIKQTKLAAVLGISQGRVSQLVNEEPANYKVLRKYIQEAGRRDSVLLLLQKEKIVD
jgi:transcriptional regulator with XRE-family HTH domain